MPKMNEKYLPDRKFLEFWGNLFLNVARGQEKMEQLSSLMNMDSINKMDLINFKEMEKLFRQSYGLPSDDSGRAHHKSDQAERLQLQESLEAFQNSFARYITMWGWVPNRTHEELKKSYETLQNDNNSLKRDYDALKQKADLQEELISQLRELLNAKGMSHMELFQHIQTLTRRQTSEFQNLMNSLQNIFRSGDGKGAGDGKEDK